MDRLVSFFVIIIWVGFGVRINAKTIQNTFTFNCSLVIQSDSWYINLCCSEQVKRGQQKKQNKNKITFKKC